jgi:transglutaminase-like putative cysteine protease
MVPNKEKELFDVFNEDLSREEKEALEFLYAYMPLNDLADYKGEFFRDIVKVSMKARKEMAWGQKVPEDVFRHFVLPYRINNENLDTFRVALYEELKERVKGLSMRDAALEVNHWCHEKVTYRGTDIRTSAPLSLIRTSWGRCGEESTFTVSALRTVGIPARQCYTPRWAHCDDNHAWVEVWVDGKWYFLGACEPEPDLNMGWFAEPARRAMLVHTRAFGAYQGSEKIVNEDEKFAELNLTSHYAPVKTFHVKVVDTKGKPVEGARVEYQLYNYAEFYPIASKLTDSKGMSHLSSGLGDLLIWASRDNQFNYQKITVEECDTIQLVLRRKAGKEYQEQFDMVPPIERVPNLVDERGRKANNLRLKKEDEIRNAYMATFMDSVQACKLANTLELDAQRVWKAIQRSTGNWKAIQNYLEQGVKQKPALVLELLETIADKDLRDTPADILLDHLVNIQDTNWKKEERKVMVKTVLNPRIANELISAYRSTIQNSFDRKFKKSVQQNPAQLIQWIKQNIQLSEKGNYYRTPITPIGVLTTKVTDLYSLNIFFVATCRSLGIPARLNQATRVPEYLEDGQWKSVHFKEYKPVVAPKGKLKLVNKDKDSDPQYYLHWTLAKFDNGKYHTLEYDWSRKFSDFPSKLELEVGDYMLVTGYRANDGTVLTKLKFFSIEENRTQKLAMDFRKVEEKPNPIGKLNLDQGVQLFESGSSKKLPQMLKGKVSVLAWIDPDKEPTKHVMVDLAQLQEKFEKLGGGFALLMDESKVSETFTSDFFKGLPKQCFYAFDSNLQLLKQLEESQKQELRNHYPVLAIVDGEGKYYFLSHGYKIGVGEQLIKTLSRLQQE